MPIVNVPNVGPVNFPDGMSDADIVKAIETDIIPKTANPTEPQGQVTVQGVPAAPKEKQLGFLDAIHEAVSPSQETIGALKKGFVGVKQAATADVIAELSGFQALDKEKYGPNYEKATPEELVKIQERDKALEGYLQKIAGYGQERAEIEKQHGINPLQKQIRDIGSTPEYQNLDTFDKLKTYGSTLWNNKSEIPGYIAGIGLESAPASLVMAVPAIVASFAKLGPGIAAGSAGVASSMMEFGNTYADYRAQKMSHEEAWEKAGVKSGAIGLFDAVSFGSAGQAAKTILKDLEKSAIKQTAKDVGKEVSVQAVYGMAGETVGSLAVNQPLDPIAIAEEGLGEIFGAPAGAVSTFKAKQQEAVNTQKELAKYQELKTADHIFTPEEQQEFDALRQKYEPQNAPPITTATPEQIAAANQPQVKSATGTPIPIVPLDTAEKQATAKAAAPVAPPTLAPQLADEEKIKQRAEQLKAEYNIPTDDAIKMARQELIEEQANVQATPIGAIGGTNQPSVPMSTQGTVPAGGTTTPSPTGLASTVSGVGRPNGGEAVQPSALKDNVIKIEDAARQKFLTGVARESFDAQLYTLNKLYNEGIATDEDYKKFEEAIKGAKDQLTAIARGTKVISEVKKRGQAAIKERTTALAANEQVAPQVPTTPEVTAPVAPEAVASQQTLQVVAPQAGVTAPVVPKGKRGRPQKLVTPEQQAVATAGKAAQTKEWKATNKTVAAAAEVLNIPEPTRDAFKTEDAFIDASLQHRSRRNKAIDTLQEVATGPRRDSKLGTTAKEALAHPSVTEQERANLTERQKVKVSGIYKPSRAEATNGKLDTRYNNFKTVEDAIKHIINTGTLFERALARRLAPFLKGVQYVIVNSKADIPNKRVAGGTTLVETFNGAAGMYAETAGEKYIFLRGSNFEDSDLHGLNNTVFLHEALHAATIGKINEYLRLTKLGEKIPAELEALVRELENIMTRAQMRLIELGPENIDPELLNLITKADILGNIKEFVAYGMTEPKFQEFLLGAEGEIRKTKQGYFKNLFDRFVNTLRSAFNMSDEHTSALQDLILVTEGLLRQAEAAPVTTEGAAAAKKTKEKVDKNLEKIRLSNSAHDITKSIGKLFLDQDFQGFKDLLDARFGAMDNGFIGKLLYNMQSADIIRWKGKEIPALKAIDDITQSMASMKLRMQHAFAIKADQLGKYIRKNGMSTLGDAMHLARLESVSPTQYKDVNDALTNDKLINQLKTIIADPNTDQTKVPAYENQLTIREEGIKKVFDAWEKLSPEGKSMYEMVRRFYKDNYTLTRTLLDDKIAKLDIEGDINDASTPKGKLMVAVRRMQEATETKFDENGKKIKSLPEEYFPFMREGSYWLRVNGPTGKEFYLFENGTDRNLYKIKRARELNVDRNDTTMFDAGDDISALRKTTVNDSAMLKEMFAAIDEGTTKGLDKEQLKDQLYQVYLMTLPEKSFRKQFLHADNVTGFSADIFHNFKVSAMRLSTQAARLKYIDDISSAVQRGRDTLSGNPDKPKLELFVNELGARAQDEISPPEPSKWATRINQFAYYWLLTAPASAATQMASVPIMVMPTLNQEYGYAKTAVKFAKYLNIWKSMSITKVEPNGDVVDTAPSLGNSRMVKGNPLLEKAFNELVERGVTTLTNTSVLTNRNRTPDNAYDNIAGVALRNTAIVMSALFNAAEQLSREVTAMMTFELEYAKTKDFEASINKAIENTQELLGRYDNFNRPRSMRNAVGRTLGQFKMYAVNVSSFFVRNGYNALNVTNPKEMLPAMERLTGVLVMGGLFHGLVGMPLYSTICSTIDAVMNNLGDEEERRKRRAKNPLTSDDSNLRFRYEFLPQHFGNIQITGLDGQKHGLNELLEKGPISALTDMNIGSRTSFDGLWFRDAKQGKTNLETVQNIILANLGPGVSTGVNMVGAVDDFNNGQIERGLEKLVPAIFKGPLVASRLASEGAETKKGDVILKQKEISDITLIGQALGFQPTKLARLQEEGFQVQKELAEARNKRIELLQKLDRTLLDKESEREDIKKVFNQVTQYNKRYPMEEFIIDGDVIESSIDKAIENKGITYRGQQIKEKLAPYLIPLRKAASPIEQ